MADNRATQERTNAAIFCLGAGTLAIAIGGSGWLAFNAQLQPIRQEITNLEGQIRNQEAAYAPLNSEVSAYWEGLVAGRAAAGRAGQTVGEQISAYCTMSALFPQTTLPRDKEFCAKVNVSSEMASKLETGKMQLGYAKGDLDLAQGYRMAWGVGLLVGATFNLLGLSFLAANYFEARKQRRATA